jgi:hypothetical protein
LKHRSFGRPSSVAVCVSLLALLIGGCLLPVPLPVRPDVTRIDEVRISDDVLVSAGPRLLLERLSRRLEKSQPGLTVVDPIAFRDTAFPEGGWRLDELLEPERRERIDDSLGVRFLVLIGAGVTQVRDQIGIFFPGLSAAAMRETTVLAAVVFDLDTGLPVCRLRSKAESIGVVLGCYIFAVIIDPMTGFSSVEKLAEAIGETLVEEAGHAPGRIALMAAEASGDPFVVWQGAPVTVGRDFAIGEMLNGLAEVETDIVPGATTRDEIRAWLGDPFAHHAGFRIDVYRLTAVAESKTRPFWFFFDFDWRDREERAYAGYLLMIYDEGWKIVDVDHAFVASAVDPPGPLEQETWTGDLSERSKYDYSFGRSAVVLVPGFRLEVEYVGKDTREALFTDPDGNLVLEFGDWPEQDPP